MTLSDGALVMIARYAATASSHFCWLKSPSAVASSACRSFGASPPSAPAGAAPAPFRSVNDGGGFGEAIVCTLGFPDYRAQSRSCALYVPGRDWRPMIESRPLSAVVAVRLLGDAFEFSAVMVAPLSGWPDSSLTVPPTRPVCAAALAANPATNSAASTLRGS